ncbi:hypothetical protein NCM_01623 [Burkholderia pseudomallei]
MRRAWVGNRVVFFILMQASDPSSGYLSDVTFPDRFHRELSPTWLNYASVLGGARPKELGRPFRYLDLGCGFAHSTVINAAAFPHAEFHACDFNPAHIEAAARARAGSASATSRSTRPASTRCSIGICRRSTSS